jgi:hypothetical protein
MQNHVRGRINATIKTIRDEAFDYSRCMAIVNRIDAAADAMNDVWEVSQISALASGMVRSYTYGQRAFFTDDVHSGTFGKILLMAQTYLIFSCLLVTALSPALVTDACDNVTVELMAMQLEASLDPKREEEAIKIGHLIHYYERKSPVPCCECVHALDLLLMQQVKST